MVSIIYFFWLLVALFTLIGAMRGWAKELLVTFSMVLALFLITLIENYVEIFKVLMTNTDETSIKNVFWIRSVIVMTLAFFGYQTTAILERFVGSKLSRDKLQDLLLGAFIGFFNGVLIVGTLLFYVHQGNYPFPEFISRPPDEMMASVEQLVSFLPPRWLGIPGIYVAVGLAFLFVLIVFI